LIEDTAATIAGLELVITVDTMVAHLAGALGRPTWLLLKHDADWRWMEGRSDSPWYPSMRLYRQTMPGDWTGVVARVVADLSAVGGRVSPRS
jgi:ADP-heptose:LPS heptosyltransferase